MKRLVIPVLFAVFITAAWGKLEEEEWLQWAQNPQHTGFVSVEGQAPKNQLADIVYDPFVAQEQAEANGELLAHYQVPLVSKKHVYMEFKTGKWVACSTPGNWVFGEACGPNTWNQQIWNEKALVWRGGKLVTDWTFQSDGKAVSQINPFGSTVDPNTFVSGPLSADGHGNVYYNALKLSDPTVADPWGESDVLGAWLVKVGPDDNATTVTYGELVPGAPAAFSI